MTGLGSMRLIPYGCNELPCLPVITWSVLVLWRSPHGLRANGSDISGSTSHLTRNPVRSRVDHRSMCRQCDFCAHCLSGSFSQFDLRDPTHSTLLVLSFSSFWVARLSLWFLLPNPMNHRLLPRLPISPKFWRSVISFLPILSMGLIPSWVGIYFCASKSKCLRPLRVDLACLHFEFPHRPVWLTIGRIGLNHLNPCEYAHARINLNESVGPSNDWMFLERFLYESTNLFWRMASELLRKRVKKTRHVFRKRTRYELPWHAHLACSVVSVNHNKWNYRR